MKITVKLTLPYDNELQFADTCNGAAVKLQELAQRALADGDHTQFKGTVHEVLTDNDAAERAGEIVVGR